MCKTVPRGTLPSKISEAKLILEILNGLILPNSCLTFSSRYGFLSISAVSLIIADTSLSGIPVSFKLLIKSSGEFFKRRFASSSAALKIFLKFISIFNPSIIEPVKLSITDSSE